MNSNDNVSSYKSVFLLWTILHLHWTWERRACNAWLTLPMRNKSMTRIVHRWIDFKLAIVVRTIITLNCQNNTHTTHLKNLHTNELSFPNMYNNLCVVYMHMSSKNNRVISIGLLSCIHSAEKNLILFICLTDTYVHYSKIIS